MSRSRTEIDDALRDPVDRWGEAELARPEGPALASIRGYLPPLALGDPDYLAESGATYVVFAHPLETPEYALHLADGSQILAEYTPRWGAPEWALAFPRPARDDGRLAQHDLLLDEEVHGSAPERLEQPVLADGHLPVLATRYRDARGTAWARESYAVRDGDRLSSRLRLRVEEWGPGVSSARVTIRTRDFGGRERSRLSRELTPDAAEISIECDPRFSRESARAIDSAVYDAGRAEVVAYWRGVLDLGARIRVADREVVDAAENLVIQNLILAEHYSIGNPYETVFMMEAHQAVLALARFGQTVRAGEALDRLVARTNGAGPEWYESWERGAKLRSAAEFVHLTGDRSLVERHAGTYLDYLDDMVRQTREDPHGLLAPERYAWDIPEPVYGFHSQAVAWRGMRDIVPLLAEAGALPDDEPMRAAVDRLRTSLLAAARASSSHLDDGSFFVPIALNAGEKPHAHLTESRMANYWNLVAPFALASGIFPAGGSEARGLLAYQRLHGAWLLGLTRFNGLYDPPTPIGEFRADGTGGYKAPGIDNAFGVQTMHFLADNDQADRMVLGLYAKLAHGMTAGTFVDGEATTVGAVDGEDARSTWYPPNGTSNAMFLDTLRLMLARETWDDDGRPRTLDVFPATARSWLAEGEDLRVEALPTAFGMLGAHALTTDDVTRAELRLDARDLPSRLRVHARRPGRRATWARIGDDPATPLAEGVEWVDVPPAAHVVVAFGPGPVPT